MKRAAAAANRDGGILTWLVIVGVAIGGYLAYKRIPAAVGITRVDGPPPNQIVMHNVRIEIFDESFRQTAELRGKTATTFKDNPDLILEPADCLLIREHGNNVRITSDKARKVIQRGSPDRLDFTGSVVVETAGRKLLSEKLTYTPNTRLLESGAPVTIKTTGSVILGEHLKTQTDLKTGTLEGDVQITSLGEGGRSLDAPVLVRGKRSEFNLDRGIFDMFGSAWAKKADSDIRGDKMTFNRPRHTLTADGNAIVSKPDLTVKAGHLEYFVDREAGTATDNPKAVQMTPRTTSEEETRTDLAAKVLDLDFKREILEGKQDVVLDRNVKTEGEWEKDYTIKAGFVTSLYGKGRSTFKENVDIDSSRVGATGDRAIFYQPTAKLYVIGGPKLPAHAWEYDEDRVKQNEIQGNKILHDLRSGKSQVLGGVTTKVNEGSDRPKRPGSGPGLRPRKPVEVKFNEGDGE